MEYTREILNGTWEMKYSTEKYESEKNPYAHITAEEDYAGTEPESMCADIIFDAVPGYWEDMTEKFQSASFYNKLRVNPEYGIQRYPIAGYAPDTALPNIIGSFFYRRDFNHQSNNGETRIYFEGVQNSVSVWINDKYIGNHEGYSTPFELDIPQNVLIDGKNTIVLSVSNHRLTGYMGEPVSGLTSRAANECTGGVTGTVEIRTYKSPLTDAAVVVSDDLRKVTVKTKCLSAASLCWSVCDDTQTLLSGKSGGDFAFAADKLKHWSPESPKLYTLKIKCGDAVLERKFGVRSLAADGTGLLLNGKPYFLRGACEHCCYPETVHPNHDGAHYRMVIKKLKSLGFNHIRFHTYIPEEEYMQAADELGMLMHVECPNNTTVHEWREIVHFCRKHPSVVIYCCGNELMIDEPFIEYLRECAQIVHKETDALFAPMSAMRGVEYFWSEPNIGKELKAEPFKHHPRRLKALGEFSDVYCTYPNGAHSYFSLSCEPQKIDEYAKVYQKPLLSHEICIDGTYADLSVKDRYKNTRFGLTEMFSSVEKHLADKGILEKAPRYFANSCEWQRRIRKFCFENLRRSGSVSGYDFLGPVDTHWHTFGYDVGMMNEFYELKPGETVRNVLMYNSPTVLLTDMGTKRNYYSGEKLNCSVFVSNYGGEDILNGILTVRLTSGGKIICCKTVEVQRAENGKVEKLCNLEIYIPNVTMPTKIMLCVTLDGKYLYAENEWELYALPRVTMPAADVFVTDSVEIECLKDMLENGKTVVIFGTKPFSSLPTSFRISLAGRTSGNLATVINDHPVLNKMAHDGYCGWQFARMLENGHAICFDAAKLPYNPIIEVASAHKYAIAQSALFEYRVNSGKLLVCSLNLDDGDPGAQWLKAELIRYAGSDEFSPKSKLSLKQLEELAGLRIADIPQNSNFAFNANDKTAIRKNKGVNTWR